MGKGLAAEITLTKLVFLFKVEAGLFLSFPGNQQGRFIPHSVDWKMIMEICWEHVWLDKTSKPMGSMLCLNLRRMGNP